MMPVHAHLFLNHVPPVGVVFGLAFFVIGMKRSHEVMLLSVRIFVGMGLVCLPVVASGLISARLLSAAAWLDSDELSTHQRAGIVALAILVTLAMLSGVVLFRVTRKGQAVPGWARKAIPALALAALGGLLFAAFHGGRLRHRELDSTKGGEVMQERFTFES